MPLKLAAGGAGSGAAGVAAAPLVLEAFSGLEAALSCKKGFAGVLELCGMKCCVYTEKEGPRIRQ